MLYEEENIPKFTIIAELPQERLQEKLDNMTYTKVIVHYAVVIYNIDKVKQGWPMRAYVLINETMECDKIPRNITIVIPITSETYKHIGDETLLEVGVIVLVEKDADEYVKLGHLSYSVTYTRYRMEKFFNNGVLHIPSEDFRWRVTNIEEVL